METPHEEIVLSFKYLIIIIPQIVALIAGYVAVKIKVAGLEKESLDVRKDMQREILKREALAVYLKKEQDERFNAFERNTRMLLENIEKAQRSDYQKLTENQTEMKHDIRGVFSKMDEIYKLIINNKSE